MHVDGQAVLLPADRLEQRNLQEVVAYRANDAEALSRNEHLRTGRGDACAVTLAKRPGEPPRWLQAQRSDGRIGERDGVESLDPEQRFASDCAARRQLNVDFCESRLGPGDGIWTRSRCGRSHGGTEHGQDRLQLHVLSLPYRRVSAGNRKEKKKKQRFENFNRGALVSRGI